MCESYETMVFKMLERTTNCPTHATAAEYLRRMRALGPGQHVDEMIELLVSTHSNRRAMVEELNKVRGG